MRDVFGKYHEVVKRMTDLILSIYHGIFRTHGPACVKVISKLSSVARPAVLHLIYMSYYVTWSAIAPTYQSLSTLSGHIF